jgi:transposase
MDKVTTIAVDIAKRTFSLYWVNLETGEIGAKAVTRAKFEEFMRTREPGRVVLETGGSAHHWARWLSRQGHEVRLIAAQHVRPFVRTNKTDGADARAIWEAASRPEVKWVAVKSEASQAVLGLHRMREQLKQMRRMQSNQLNALLYEFGVVTKGRITAAQLEAWVAAGRVPQLLAAGLGEQIERIARLRREELQIKRAIERHNESAGDAAAGGAGNRVLGSERLVRGARRRREELCQRPPICRMQGHCPSLERHRRQGAARGDQQARRSLCAHAAHSRRAERDRESTQSEASVAMAEELARAPAAQCGSGGSGQQDGAYRLGACRARTVVPAALHRASGVADQPFKGDGSPKVAQVI